MGINRILEANREELRKDFLSDLHICCNVMGNDVLARNVDEDAVNKCRLSQYGKIQGDVKRMVNSTEDALDMQKARDTQHWAGAVDARSFDLDQNVEKIYFDYYGENFQGGPVMDRPGMPYRCPCGLKMLMDARTLPLECPTCHRLTPVGKLQRDGVIKR